MAHFFAVCARGLHSPINIREVEHGSSAVAGTLGETDDTAEKIPFINCCILIILRLGRVVGLVRRSLTCGAGAGVWNACLTTRDATCVLREGA